MKIFVTGYHRAGTHTAAEYLSSKNKVDYFEESRISWDSFEAAECIAKGYSPTWDRDDKGVLSFKKYRNRRLDKGFVLQCPGLAHKVIDAAKLGKVYWVIRDKFDIVKSMGKSLSHEHLYHMMNQFHDEFPNDSIWPKLQKAYQPNEDFSHDFVEYCSCLYAVKMYFYNKYFKNVTELLITEDQDYYRGPSKKYVSSLRIKQTERALEKYESICLG